MTPYDLTPVQAIGRLRVKRDDLFAPYECNGVNGGKLRQCVLLAQEAAQDAEGIITYCSIGSPQAPISAAVARDMGKPCIILYGGTSRESLLRAEMPSLVMHYGGKIVIGAKTGRHNVLHSVAAKIAREKHYFLVQYGINLTDHEDVLLSAVAAQTANLPDCENLVAVCGSGITASGILVGLKQNGINVKHVHLVATAPDRRAFIHGIASRYGADRPIEYHDLYHTRGFSYDKPARAKIGSVILHPNYEAKAYLWYKQSGLSDEDTVFWITGAKPTIQKAAMSRGYKFDHS